MYSKNAEKWRHIPKVELHCHLEGCIPYETLLDEHQRQDIPLPGKSPEECHKAFVLEEPAKDLEDALPTLERGVIIFGEPRAISRVAEEVVFGKALENVKLLELRYAPSCITSRTKNKLTLDEIHSAIQEGIRNGMEKAKQIDKEIHVFLIAAGLAVMGYAELQKIVDFVIKHKEDFVGFDLCGPEKDLEQYSKFLDQINQAEIDVTIHAAESKEPKNAQIAVEKLHAKRIGHGIKVVKDPAVFSFLRDRHIHLEISPISNLCTGEVEAPSDHPIKVFLEAGFSLSVNSDDPACFGSSISEDYSLLNETCGFSAADFFRINRTALEASFAPKEIKNALSEMYFSSAREAKWISNQESSSTK